MLSDNQINFKSPDGFWDLKIVKIIVEQIVNVHIFCSSEVCVVTGLKKKILTLSERNFSSTIIQLLLLLMMIQISHSQ